VVWTYSGVRALYDEDESENASALSRDYLLELDTAGAPLLSVYGGKITTYRTLATEAMAQLRTVLRLSERDWTGCTALPGGDIPEADFEHYLAQIRGAYPELASTLVTRLTRNYGTRVHELLAGVTDADSLGECFGADLYEVELCYLQDNEWVMTAEDAVWRRSKLGLHLSDAQLARINQWLAERSALGDMAPQRRTGTQ
jgi:glycerol-3-phosphate dehydrogenase